MFPHTVFVHKGWFRDQEVTPVPTKVERTTNSVIVTYGKKDDSIGFSDRVINPKKLPMVHTDKFYMPNNTRVDYIYGENERGFVITSTCTPISPWRTKVYTCISYRLGILQSTAALWLPWYTRKVIEQDVEIMKIQRDGINGDDVTFKSTGADLPHIYIEALRDAAVAGKQPPRPQIREIDF
ncbi:MAG: hypothetical protein HRU19_31755 [Pseudobacteriovorax sp.]|nr:hypothetical protein [Pseudobacteriovorax sp.]